MELNKKLILESNLPPTFSVPDASVFGLPEKVLQFGTGVLLRGLPDYYIDKANKQGIFNGRVVVIKSTGKAVDEFGTQDGLYTQCVKGIVNGSPVEENIINASISKVLPAQQSWKAIMQYAESSDMQVIISNTTEIGIALKEDDDIHAAPPISFPAKLLAFLYKRFQHFKGSAASGMVIVPTELIVDNASKLKEIVVQLAEINTLDNAFMDWLHTANDFCNSLVDRIVPGALKRQDQLAFEQKAGYKDALTIMSEPYSLWAIESSSEKTKEILSFHKAGNNVIITPDINKYRELKLRLLNGTHSFSCGLAYLAGFDLVYEAMQETSITRFIRELMLEEIVPCIMGTSVRREEAETFAHAVIDRFCNPSIEHKWLGITMQYTAKMKMRNVPLLQAWYTKTRNIPTHMAAGFAAYILFMKAISKEEGCWYGTTNGKKYKIEDDKAGYFYELWRQYNSDEITGKVLSDTGLWGVDLAGLNGFAATVQYFLRQFERQEFTYAITRLAQGSKIAHEA